MRTASTASARRKLWKAARRAGLELGRDQAARLMLAEGIAGARRTKRVRTTRPDDAAGRHPDLVRRDFTATAPNQLWVTDLTYVPTWAGVADVCFIIDVFSRAIVGWRVAGHMRTPMVLDAIEMARWSRGTQLPGLRCHSDAGSQFTSIRYGERFAEIGAVPRSGPSATATTMPWPRPSTAPTRPSSSAARPDRGHGAPSRTSSWPPSAGSRHNTSRLHGYLDDVPPSEFEAAFYAAQQPAPAGVGNR